VFYHTAENPNAASYMQMYMSMMPGEIKNRFRRHVIPAGKLLARWRKFAKEL